MRVTVRHGVLGLVIALAIALGGSAAAQDEVARDYVSCGHFDTQEDAQEALEELTDPTLRSSLDGDGDGIACESRFGEPGGETEGVRELPATGIGGAPAAGTDPALLAALAAVGLGGGGAIARRVRLS